METTGNLFRGFHVMYQIINYTLKLMEILFKSLWGYLWHVTTKINFVCHSRSLSIYFSRFPSLWHYLLALNGSSNYLMVMGN
jgi:hypothetical protein